MPSPIQRFLHVTKYATLDELHENNSGFRVDVLPCSVKEVLVSIKLHIWQLLLSHVKFLIMLWCYCSLCCGSKRVFGYEVVCL